MSWYYPRLAVLCVLIVSGVDGCAHGLSAASMYPDIPVRLVTQQQGLPEGAEKLKSIEVRGDADLQLLAHELKKATQQMGGNLAKIDRVITKFKKVYRDSAYYSGKRSSGQNLVGTAGHRLLCDEGSVTVMIGTAYKVETP